MIFEPRTYQATATIGASIAGLAIPDAVTVLHGGAGCDIKLHSLMRHHNPTGDVHRRVVCTKITEADLVLDPGEVLTRSVADIVRRVGARLLVVTSASFVEVAGIDRDRLVEELEHRLGIPAVYVYAPDFAGDLFEGYSRALAALAQRFGRPAAAARPRPDAVNLLGYLFDRPLLEHRANLDLLASYLRALSLDLNRCLLDGLPSAGLSDLPQAAANLVLPGGEAAGAILHGQLGQAAVQVPWPIGFAATRSFLQAVGDAFGRGDAARALADREEERCRTLLRQAADPLVGRRVAIFADGGRLAGLLGLCRDLRMVPVLAGALDGRAVRLGDAVDAGLQVLDGPGAKEVEDRLRTAAAEHAVDVVLGTAHEVQIGRRCGIPGVEVGFPCRAWQPLYPSPFLGFDGVLATATRLQEVLVT